MRPNFIGLAGGTIWSAANCGAVISLPMRISVFEKLNAFQVFECKYSYSNMVKHKYYFENEYKTLDFFKCLGLFHAYGLQIFLFSNKASFLLDLLNWYKLVCALLPF